MSCRIDIRTELASCGRWDGFRRAITSKQRSATLLGVDDACVISNLCLAKADSPTPNQVKRGECQTCPLALHMAVSGMRTTFVSVVDRWRHTTDFVRRMRRGPGGGATRGNDYAHEYTRRTFRFDSGHSIISASCNSSSVWATQILLCEWKLRRPP